MTQGRQALGFEANCGRKRQSVQTSNGLAILDLCQMDS
jgi:hypothetical protein